MARGDLCDAQLHVLHELCEVRLDCARVGSAVADRDPVLRADEGPNITIAYLAGHDVTDPEASPVFGAFDAAFPPTLITTGTRDMLLSSCVRLARVMREGGAAVDLRVWEGLWHVFEFYPDIPEAELSLTEIADFLRPRL